MAFNPYESPKCASSMPARYLQQPTRWKAVRVGMCRGAKIGFFTIVIVMFVAVLVACVVAIIGHFLADWRFPSDLELATWFDVVKGLGMFMLGLCVWGALYGAIPGAIILGTIAAVRWRRPETVLTPQIS